MDRRLFLAAMPLLGAAFAPAFAQTPPASPPMRVRGTVGALNGNVLTVNSRDGQKLDIALNEPVTVVTVKKVDLAAIKSNDYVGIATRTAADGKQTAIEVLVFPEAMRGAGEGHYAWDLEPGSMMTNGTVKGAVQATSGRELTVAYKDSSTTIDVPPGAAVVTFAPATAQDLKPGAHVFCIATKNPEGKLAAARVTVETGGVAPPM